MTYSAHSPKDGYKAQPYEEHIDDVVEKAKVFARKVAKYGAKDGRLIEQLAGASALYHDMGKLESENQQVLTGERSARKLPYHHQDAGVAHLLSEEHLCKFAAVAVSAHHTGLPDIIEEEEIREESAFRDKDKEFQKKTDEILPELMKIHKNLIASDLPINDESPVGDRSVFLRLVLSCLADADHTNTATHYGKYPEKENIPELQPAKRLAALDAFMLRV